jgi:hypothetical protein
VLKETESALAVCQHEAVKPKRSKKERDKGVLDAVAREMARPCLVESARQQEEATARRATKRKRKLRRAMRRFTRSRAFLRRAKDSE